MSVCLNHFVRRKIRGNVKQSGNKEFSVRLVILQAKMKTIDLVINIL